MLDKIYVGNTNVKKAYVGNSQISLKSNPNNYFIKTNKSGEFILKLSSIRNQNIIIDFGNGINRSIELSATVQLISINYNDNSEKNITISAPEIIDFIDCNSMSISEINLSLFTSLNKLVCYNNNINSLDFSNNSQIQFIHCFNNPIVTNDSELNSMINSLPDRNNKAYGSIIIDNKTQRLKVEKTAISKDWLFGSAIMYNQTEWDKCGYHIKQSGIADIWESAEMGEGLTIAIIDHGFDLNCIEYDTSKIKYKRNFSNQGNYNEVPLPTSGQTTHGNSTSNILMAKGVNMYGICPKASYVLIKASDSSSVSYTNWVSNAINYSKNLNVDVVTMSLAFSKENTTLLNAVRNLCLPNYSRSYKGIPLVCSNYNTGDNNSNSNEISYPGGYKYPISIGSISSKNLITSWSPSYDGIDVVTYGVYIRTQESYNTYVNFSGTSPSTAIVAGILSLLINIFIKKYARKPSENEIYNELIKRTIPMNYDYKSCGVGRLNLTSYNSNPTKIQHT